MPRYLALDWGEKRTGVAISDDGGTLAVGYDIWPTSELFSRLAQTVREEGVSLIVMGYPLTLRGEAGPKARQVDHVIAELERRGYAVRRCDERYTTADASRSLTKAGISQRKQRGRVDMAAAVLLLQSYLDRTRESGEENLGG